jgi:uncharacterized protein (DUF1778 family)
MAVTKIQREKRGTLNLRIKPAVRSLIDHAAEITGKNRTEFVLDAARQAAENALLDQRIIALNPKAYATFLSLLDEPAHPNKRLKRTLTTPAPWD